MNSLAEALSVLDLKPGKPVRTRIDDREIEVRLLPNGSDDELPNEKDQEMRTFWLTIPPSPDSVTIEAPITDTIYPPPYRFDESDLTPE